VIQGLAMAMAEQQAWNFIRLFLVCYCLTAIESRVPLLPLADLDIKGKSLQLSSTSMRHCSICLMMHIQLLSLLIQIVQI
jgi:hypothetical protein